MNSKRLFFAQLIPGLMVCLIFVSSCKKYIYQAPIDSTYGAEFWTSQTAVEQATIAMYADLRSSLRGNSSTGAHFIFGDLASGTFIPAEGQWNYQDITASNNPPFDFSYVPYLEPDLQDWTRFYQLIAQSNLILKNVPKMPAADFSSEAIRNSYLGEALFMRAYTYFYMIRVWGDPIYVTKTYDNVDYGNIPPLARTPETTVLDSCLIDLKTAASYLGYAGGDPTKSIRGNKGSVLALIANIYAWQHQYDSAHAYCQQVINNGGYSLEPITSYKNIWNGQSSQESIFEIPMTYNANDPNFIGQTNSSEALFSFFGTYLKGSIVNNINTQCWLSPIGGFVDQYFDTTNDLRYHAVLTLMPASGGDVEGYMLTKYANFIYQQPASQTLPYINNDLVLFRLSDIYLLDAEALAYLNNLSACQNQLSQTEIRAGIKTYQNLTSQSDLLNEIIAERGRELIGEGQWYYDLIRTEPTQGWLELVGYYPAERVNTTNKGYYWPLNLTTLFPQDNLLTQNPWWAVHK